MSFRGELAFLSNMYNCKVIIHGRTYPSAENAYQAYKSGFVCQKFETISPVSAKKLGRELTMRDDWEDIKLSAMDEILTAKFKNKSLLKKLLSTGQVILVEKNYWRDYYWGVCNGKGENHLGKILMGIRERNKPETGTVL